MDEKSLRYESLLILQGHSRDKNIFLQGGGIILKKCLQVSYFMSKLCQEN